MVAGQDVPDVVDVARASPEPGVGVRLVDLPAVGAADVGQPLGGELFGADERAIGGADTAGRQAVEPRVIHKLFRELLALIGQTPAAGCDQQPMIALGRRGAVQSAHDLEHRVGVFLVVQQPLQRTPRLHPVELGRHRLGGGLEICGVGHGHRRTVLWKL